MVLRLNGGDTPGRVDAELLRLERSRHKYPRHAHEGYAIGAVESGAHAFNARGRRWEAVPGRIILVNPEDIHDGGPATANGSYSYRMIYLNPEMLREIVSEAIGRHAELPFFPRAVVVDRDLSNSVLTLHRALEASHSRLERDGRFVEVLLGLVLRHSGARLASETDRLIPQPLDRVVEFLANRFADDISLAMLADLAGLDRFRLLRQFRRRFGLPPHAYQTLLRLRHARMLLRSGESAASTALAAGFADQSHMIRKFKAVYGMTPGQYQGRLQ